MQDTNATKVVFRVWKEGGVIAFFPELPATNEGFLCDSYEHVGQHGAADYEGCVRETRPALFKEYEPLAKELEGIGYKLDVRQRASRKMHATRFHAVGGY